ncbi:MAG: 2-hydroxyacyl-CoA dehydratase family protein [Defluviitaleaceae bacterium]|nr:2-hydroxyacyl-CoA dehydratase family protein [Defluviitaleaceae bacterium]
MNEIFSSNQTTPESLSNQVFQECECIEKIRKTSLSGAEYFFELAAQYFNIEHMQKRNPKVIVLGTALPPEILYAFTSENPLWVFGGSRTMTAVSDSDVPRDTDPISRAMLGYLQAATQMAKTALVIVPLVSDNQRKLAYILKDQGWNVETVHLPPYASIGGDVYDDEIRRLCGVLSMHLNKRLPSFKKAALFMEKIGVAIRRFTSIASARPGHISGSARMLILNSFYMAQDLNRWLAQLSKLSDELDSIPATSAHTQPKFLLIGSPVYFCCYKIPLLLHDIGADLCAYIDPGLYRFAAPRTSGKNITRSSIAAAQLNYDMSGAFIDNDILLSALKEQVELTKPDGVIWHILRGQNEYDFELIRLESYITDNLDIPVFRLETDYQYQDVEQMRVRMEAFAELTSHRKTSQKEGGS